MSKTLCSIFTYVAGTFITTFAIYLVIKLGFFLLRGFFEIEVKLPWKKKFVKRRFTIIDGGKSYLKRTSKRDAKNSHNFPWDSEDNDWNIN